MKILQVNKFLYRRAGAEAYMLDLAELLAEHGHEVMLWGTRENVSCIKYNVSSISKYKIHNTKYIIQDDLLVEPLNYDRREGFGRDFKKFGHMVWSLEAAKKFEAVLRQFKPDIIHVHNIYHHISPSILAVARRHKIPVVQTLHDFKSICPNYKLFTHGSVCQRCKRYRYWNAVRHGCLQGSCVASAVAALEMWTHRALQVYEKGVAKFITPSNFLRDLLIQWGKNENKILHLPNFIAPLTPTLSPMGRGGENDSRFPKKLQATSYKLQDYILFAGRLAEEKGIWLLLEIAKALPEIKFKVAGDGPDFKKLQATSYKLQAHNVELLGFQEKSALQELIAGARLIIVPSIWYENYPMSVLEAQAMGKAVIASAIGGIPEMIEDGRTGFLAPTIKPSTSLRSAQAIFPELVEGWVDRIKQIYHDDVLLEKVGQAAKERVLRENEPEKHYERMLEIYQESCVKIFN